MQVVCNQQRYSKQGSCAACFYYLKYLVAVYLQAKMTQVQCLSSWREAR
jgi:hypothetical protein